jgi:uncharacterized membrane protein HdeD (DUF308 family)
MELETAKTAVRHGKRSLLLVLGALQVAAGATVAIAPHLATVLGPRPFAIAMIVTGVGSAVLAFVRSQLEADREGQ